MAKKSFEHKLEKLTEIAEALENGEISLGDSLKLYKEAVKAANEMLDELETAAGSVVIMQKELDGVFTEEVCVDGF